MLLRSAAIASLALLACSSLAWAEPPQLAQEKRTIEAPKAGQLAPATPKLQGAVIEGGNLKALPGYELVPGPNQTMMIKAAGGGLGHTFDGCGCKNGTGTCTVETTSPTSASCGKRSGDTCNGECTFSTTKGTLTPNVMQ
jgi:hypothetical protein